MAIRCAKCSRSGRAFTEQLPVFELERATPTNAPILSSLTVYVGYRQDAHGLLCSLKAKTDVY